MQLVKNLKLYKLLASFSYLIFLAGCGYRWQPEYPCSERPTITVPFVRGDEDGSLTNEIIRALSTSGLADVRHSGGDYRLQVTMKDSQFETIGYRRDRQKITGEIKKNLLACEGRKTLNIEAILFQGEQIAYGPYQISAQADYDYVDGDSLQDLTFISATGVFTTVLPFSLGQLESNETAQEAATRPIYAKIAQKIVDALSSEW
ncbi:MAG TPA: LPS assembly lipoprotein LptE [Chlamydiales bacterium]|nr:LPS assembly lipoprotein LptE [Chlamydiales bacterium]